MKLTPSAKYLALARGAGKVIRWKFYVRKVSALNVALGSGTWTEITSRIDIEAFEGVASRIEYEIGQFTTDQIPLTGKGIQWFKNNVFNLSAGEYAEVKVEATIDGASDVMPMFAGFIDPVGAEPGGVVNTELTDTVDFTVYSPTDVASRMAGENISTRYVNEDVYADGSNVRGLILTKITGLYVTNANVSSYVLKVGVHTISYEYNDGTERAKLDEGRWVNLAAGANTLGNAEIAGDDTERLTVEIAAMSELSRSPEALVGTIVVATAGDTLPKQWYYNVSLKYLLREIYRTIGIETLTSDTLEIDTFDGNNKASFWGTPPDDITVAGTKRAIVSDGTDLYLAIGNKIYKRTTSDGQYTLKATIATGARVSRLLYHKRVGDHEDLWIFYGTNTAGNGKVNCYRIDADALCNEITITTTMGQTHRYAIDVVDFNYTGSSYKYAFVYIRTISGSGGTFGDITRSGSTLTNNAAILSSSSWGHSGSFGLRSEFLYYLPPGKLRIRAQVSASIWEYDEVLIDSSGVYVANGLGQSGPSIYFNVAVYHPAQDRIYFWDYDGFIKSHPTGSVSITTNYTSAFDEVINTMIVGSDNVVYFTSWDPTPSAPDIRSTYHLFTIESNNSAKKRDAGIYTLDVAMTYGSGRLFGVDIAGRLFQYHNKIALYVPLADAAGISVLDLLTQLAQGFNLITKPSHLKTAYAYRRGDNAGAPFTTGNTLGVTVREASDLVEVVKSFVKVDLVVMSGETDRVTYDGTTFGAAVLSDKRQLEISSKYIPDNILKDLAKQIFAFFNINRNLYRIPLGVLPLFHYEPFDAGSVTFSGTSKIQKTGSGPLYACEYARDGSMSVEALI